jgi:putative flippase GtrA
MPADSSATQTEGLRVLLAMSVSPPEPGAEVDERKLTASQTSTLEHPEGGLSLPPTPPTADPTRQRAPGRATGRHAAAPPPYLERRGARFVLFSAIGGFVFLMGLGLQVGLTGRLHMLAVASYLIQAVASVETSFLLNRWLTWRDRDTPFWRAFTRFNAQKTVTIALNLALYVGLLRLGMNYLAANVLLTVVFTVVNYVAGDRLVFIPGRAAVVEPAAPVVLAPAVAARTPSVSVVIPCRGNERTIGETVRSLLDQDYPGLREIVLIGSPGDSTWTGLMGIDHPRLSTWELETPPGVRDANFKRDAAVRMTSGELIALIDSDIVLPYDWMSRAIAELDGSSSSCVAGGMKSFHNSFWGRYTDSAWIGAKTPRIPRSYTVTSANFGAHGRKPPILANTLFTRELYERCRINPMWSHGSYEDYEWFWRVTKSGYSIRVCRDLFGWHHHRRGLRTLAKEYRRSSRGCAYFIRAHRDSPLARRRLRQAVLLPLLAVITATAAAAATAHGYGIGVVGLFLSCAAVLAVHQVARSRSLESLAYPAVGLALGLVFTTGLVTNLLHASSSELVPMPTSATSEQLQPNLASDHVKWRFLPIAAICTVQAALSLALVWSNTSYVDEANDLWIGRLEIAHWLHGSSLPPAYAFQALPGSPLIYPPLGALADRLGGLAGARILSLGFMLLATVLLYLTASRLIGRSGALIASALWAFSEPAIRLAFATADPLSILLTTLAAWLVVRAGHQRRRGELVAAAALALASANVTAYPGLVIDPVVIAFAYLTWRTRMPAQQALSCTAWLTAAFTISLGLLMTLSHSWTGLFSSVFTGSHTGSQSPATTIGEIWGYSSLIIGLALIGAIFSFQSLKKNNVAALGGACFAIYFLMQFHSQTPWTIDKHLAYGVWFAAIAAGYACSKFVRRLPGSKELVIGLCCAALLTYPAAVSWQSAWQRYHAWPDAENFISAFKPVVANAHGLIFLPPREINIAEYYTPEGNQWATWSGAMSLDPSLPANQWRSYYSQQLSSQKYGVVALFYVTTFSSVSVPDNLLLSNDQAVSYRGLLNLVGDISGEPGLPALTEALEKNPAYHLVSTGPYNTSNVSGTHEYGIYAIWREEQP